MTTSTMVLKKLETADDDQTDFNNQQQREKEEQQDQQVDDGNKQHTNWKSIYIMAVVTFIASLEYVTTIMDWNYFCQLDSGATITFYGIMRTAWGIGAAISPLVAGWVCNKLQDTREVLIGTKLVIFLAFCLFLGVELVHGGFMFYALFLLYKLLCGIAGDAGGVASRTHIAMASTEADRARAIAICIWFPAIGVLCGYLITSWTSFMPYPGIQLPIIHIHVNLFTAPMLFCMLIFLVALYMLIFEFDGKWHNLKAKNADNSGSRERDANAKRQKQEEEAERRTRDDGSLIVAAAMARVRTAFSDLRHFLGKFDCVGVGVCLFTQLVFSFQMIIYQTINLPYQQIAFQWDAATLQYYISICGAAIAVQLIVWPLAYQHGLNKILSERHSVMAILVLMLASTMLTYPWPFLPDTIPYINPSSNGTTATAAVAAGAAHNESATRPAASSNYCGGHTQPGCPRHYTWCATTTKPNMPMYIITQTLAIGMSMPILRVNLDSLYSKMLGTIKQPCTYAQKK